MSDTIRHKKFGKYKRKIIKDADGISKIIDKKFNTPEPRCWHCDWTYRWKQYKKKKRKLENEIPID